MDAHKEWEIMYTNDYDPQTTRHERLFRMKVAGGYLYRNVSTDTSNSCQSCSPTMTSIVFVPWTKAQEVIYE